MSTKANVPHQLTAISGYVSTAVGVSRPATDKDVPLPSGYLPDYSQVEFAHWSANLARYVPQPNLELPMYDGDSWKTLESLADTKALGNLGKALVNLPLIFAERRETIELIGRKVAFIAKTVKSAQERSLEQFKLTRYKDRRRVAQAIAGEHLALVFGMLPLVDEVEGLIEFVTTDRLDFLRSRGIQVKASDTTLKTSTAVMANDGWPNYFRGKWGTVWTGTREVNLQAVRTALRYKLTTAVGHDFYKLGFDPVGAAFDLVPLSFMTGWVSNFDYWIRSLSPFYGLEFETGSRNRRTYREVTQKSWFNPDGVYTVYGGSKAFESMGNRRRDERTVLFAAPDAALHWDVEVGLYEVAAGASIAVQRYLKPLKRVISQKQFRYKGPRPKWLPQIRYTGRTQTNV